MILKIAILLILAGFHIEGREIINLQSKKSNVDGFWGKLLYGGGGNDIKNVPTTTLHTPIAMSGQPQKPHKTNINGYLYAEPRQFNWGGHHATEVPIIAGSELNMKVKPSGTKSKKNKVVETPIVNKKIENKSVTENQDLVFKLTPISKSSSQKKINTNKGSGSEYVAVVA